MGKQQSRKRAESQMRQLNTGRGIQQNEAIEKDRLNGLSRQEKIGRGYLSKSGKQEALRLDYDSDDDNKLLELNDQLEKEFGDNLEHETVSIAQMMAYTVGGYTTYGEAEEYIKDNLSSPAKDIDDLKKYKAGKRIKEVADVGTEGDLIDYLKQKGYNSERLGLYQKGHAGTLERATENAAILKEIKSGFDKDHPTDSPEHKKMRQLFRKIYFTVKLNEMLLSQMGYFGGSMEFKAGLEHDLEYWVYLLSTKTRGPRNQMLENAAKPMKPYRTYGIRTPLPDHNQFSMSKGHAEFADVDDIPMKDRAIIEEKLNEFQKVPSNKESLEKLLNTKKEGAVWTLAEVLSELKNDENKRKTLYTDFLKLSWSDIEYGPSQNPFQGQTLTLLKNEDIKDKRITGLENLGKSSFRAHVVGRKANILLTAESASEEFRAKLDRLTADEVIKLYGKLYRSTEGMNTTDRVENLKDSAMGKAKTAISSWYKNARAAHKPIYAGPSGHTIGYLNLYKKAYDQDEELKKRMTDKSVEKEHNKKKPNLEEARLVMHASLIGKKEHHSYDEVMLASKGIHTEKNASNGNNLRYTWRGNYKDMWDSQYTNGVAKRAIEEARRKVYLKFLKLPAYGKVIERWNKNVF